MISYYELLTLIKEGEQPDKVKYKYFEYEFHEDGVYINENSGYLNSDLADDFGDLPLIEDKVIEIIEEKPKQIEEIKLAYSTTKGYYIKNLANNSKKDEIEYLTENEFT